MAGHFHSAWRVRVEDVVIAADDPLLTFEAFIARLNVSARTGRALLARGLIGTVRIGRCLRIPESEITRFLNERYSPPRQAAAPSPPPFRRPGADDLDAVLDRAIARQRGSSRC